MLNFEMPTIDRTEEWEETLDGSKTGSLKFPISILDRESISDIGEVKGSLSISKPRMVNSKVREIKLGKSHINRNKGNKLF